MELSSDFEASVLATCDRLKGNAYGVSITEELSKVAGRRVSYASVNLALKQLLRNGLLISEMTDGTPERGGRRKRLYRLTGEGRAVLQSARTSVNEQLAVPALSPA